MVIKHLFLGLCIVFFLCKFVIALEVALHSPEGVEAEQDFSVTLEADSVGTESYDVKIFVNKHTKEFSEIYVDGVLKSPFNYLTAAFPETKEFTLVAHVPGETQICARIRGTSDKSAIAEVCNPIEVFISKRPEIKKSEEQEEEKASTSITTNKSSSSENIQNSISASIENLSENKNAVGKIHLNAKSKTEKTQELQKEIISKSQRIRAGLVYGFIFLCIFIIILLALRKL